MKRGDKKERKKTQKEKREDGGRGKDLPIYIQMESLLREPIVTPELCEQLPLGYYCGHMSAAASLQQKQTRR
jgi:hypothetical protein